MNWRQQNETKFEEKQKEMSDYDSEDSAWLVILTQWMDDETDEHKW